MNEILCSPCDAGLLSIPAEWKCHTCQEYFCQNCKKIHQAKEWSKRHVYESLQERKQEVPNVAVAFTVAKAVSVFKSEVSPTSRHSTVSGTNRKLQYMKDLEARHDHLEFDHDVEYFCPKHGDVVCDDCREIVHFYCDGLQTIPEAAAWLTSCSAAIDIVRKLKIVCKYSTAAWECFNESEKTATDSYQHIISKFRFNENAENLSHIRDLRKEHQKHLEYFDKQMKICRSIQNASRQDSESLSTLFSMSNPSSMVKLYVQIRRKCLIYEKMLKEIHTSAYNVKYLLKKQTGVSLETEVVVAPNNLPPYVLEENNSTTKLKTKPTGQSKLLEVVTPHLSVERSNTVLTFSALFGQNFGVSGLEVTSSGNVIMADRQRSCVYVVNKDRGIFSTYECSSLPWEVSHLGDNVFFTSIPGEQAVFVLKLVSTIEKQSKDLPSEQQCKLVKECTITCPGECFGLCYCQGKLFVTLNAWTQNPYLGFFKMDDLTFCSHPEFVSVTVEGPPLIAPQHIECSQQGHVFLSDCGSNTVIGLSPNGQTLYLFSSKDMTSPTGLAVAPDCSVYVACRDTDCIYKINPMGSKGRVLLCQDDGINKPRSLCYDGTNKRLLLVENSSCKLRFWYDS